MSGSAYRLETARPRPPPPPLRFQDPSQSSSVLSGHNPAGSQTLLYDLPCSTITSPTSPKSKPGFASPTSPSFPGRSRTPRSARPTPPTSARNRSTTPLGVPRSDFEKFAEYCREWYYNQDDDSGRLMTQTLANLPPSQRAPFSRLQASIRSAYHAHISARRNAEFQAHLTATQPGGSLMPRSRTEPLGHVAQKERHERFERFIRNWCTMGMPGTKPFFEALWAVMRLQVIPEHLGGAGGNKIEWEIDDAVFKEAAGKDFMLEAIDVLKGVLAFEEISSPTGSPTSNRFDAYSNPLPLHLRSQSQPLPSDRSHRQKASIATTVQAKRARAPSDPFLDTPALSHSLALASSHSSGKTAALSALADEDADELPSPITPPADQDELIASSRGDVTFDESEASMRIWTSPDLPNHEIISLLKAFPAFITRRPLPRFPVASRRADIEEGDEERGEGKEIRFGTGSMWMSSKQRSDGWEGGWWARFVLWWRKIFC